MGTLTYNKLVIELDDKLLMDLQIVIGEKMRRHEGFLMSWREPEFAGGGVRTVWIHPGVQLYLRYSGSSLQTLNHDLLESLATSASSASGLLLHDLSGNTEGVARSIQVE